jgi:uncharacterized membrane protein
MPEKKTVSIGEKFRSFFVNKKKVKLSKEEIKFKQATKMTLQEAEKRVTMWYKNEEMKKVERGVTLILEYFPNHRFKNNPPDIIEEKDVKKVNKASFFNIEMSIEELEMEGLPQENDINDEERVFAGISYLPFLSFFVLSRSKNSDFVMFHAWQGFTLFAIFLSSLPVYFLFQFLLGILFWFMYMILFGFSFFAGYRAWSGKYIKIPIVSNLAKQLSGKS